MKNYLKKWWNKVVETKCKVLEPHMIEWGALMYEKIQQGMEKLQIPFDESPLFYVAVAVAVVSLAHTCVEALEKD